MAYEYVPDPTHVYSALLPPHYGGLALDNPGPVAGLAAATAVGAGLTYAYEAVQSKSVFVPTVADAQAAAPAVGLYVVSAGVGSMAGLLPSLALGAVAYAVVPQMKSTPMIALWAIGSFLGSRYARA